MIKERVAFPYWKTENKFTIFNSISPALYNLANMRVAAIRMKAKARLWSGNMNGENL